MDDIQVVLSRCGAIPEDWQPIKPLFKLCCCTQAAKTQQATQSSHKPTDGAGAQHTLTKLPRVLVDPLEAV